MDNWDSSITYQMALQRHSEDLARGDASRQLPNHPRRQPIRARLANAMVTLAAHLDPASLMAQPPSPSTTQSLA